MVINQRKHKNASYLIQARAWIPAVRWESRLNLAYSFDKKDYMISCATFGKNDQVRSGHRATTLGITRQLAGGGGRITPPSELSQ